MACGDTILNHVQAQRNAVRRPSIHASFIMWSVATNTKQRSFDSTDVKAQYWSDSSKRTHWTYQMRTRTDENFVSICSLIWNFKQYLQEMIVGHETFVLYVILIYYVRERTVRSIALTPWQQFSTDARTHCIHFLYFIPQKILDL